MIEVALAMAIIAFGMTSILGLFPVGLNASRASIAENSGSDAAEQLAAYLKSTAEYVDIPAKFDDAFKKIFITPGTQLLPDFADLPTEEIINNLSVPTKPASTTNFTDSFAANPGAPVNFTKTGNFQIYKATDVSAKNAIFFICQGVEDSASRDFSAMIKVWKSPVSANFKKLNVPITESDNTYDYSGGINLEISWPIETFYSQREKRYYYIEVLRPQ